VLKPWQFLFAALLATAATAGPPLWLVSRLAPSSQQAKPYDQTQPATAEQHHPSASDKDGVPPHGQNHRGEGQEEYHWYNTLLDHTPDWFVALFTAALVGVTVALVRSTNRLWEAGEKQFVATNRPRIIVRFVQGPMTDAEGRVSATVTIANTGPTDAKIIAIGCDIAFRRDFRWMCNVDGEPKPIAPITLRSGQRHMLDIEAREGNDDDVGNFYINWGFMRAADETTEGARSFGALCVVGEIVYRDDIGTERHTSFLRLYEPDSRRWIRDTDPSHEYED
jgi:hypothetical protein